MHCPQFWAWEWDETGRGHSCKEKEKEQDRVGGPGRGGKGAEEKIKRKECAKDLFRTDPWFIYLDFCQGGSVILRIVAIF